MGMIESSNEPGKFIPHTTVGELRQHLSLYPDDMEIYFEGFDFYRVKQRGPNLLQIELNEKQE